MSDLKALMAAAELQSAQAFSKRKELEEARIGIAQQINQCEKYMLTLDGRMDVLKELIAAQPPQEP